MPISPVKACSEQSAPRPKNRVWGLRTFLAACALFFSAQLVEARLINPAFDNPTASSIADFISRDPLQEEGGVNLYGYGKGSPLSIDPLGLVNVVVSGTDGTQILSKDVRDPFSPTSYLDYAGDYYFGKTNYSSVGSFMTPTSFLRKKVFSPITLIFDIARPVFEDPFHPIRSLKEYGCAIQNLMIPNFFTHDVQVNGKRVSDIIVNSQDSTDILMGHSQGVTLIGRGVYEASLNPKARKTKTIKLILMAPKIRSELLDQYILHAKWNQPDWTIKVLIICNAHDTLIPCGTAAGYRSHTFPLTQRGVTFDFPYWFVDKAGDKDGDGPHDSAKHTGLRVNELNVTERRGSTYEIIRNKLRSFIDEQ